MRPCKNCPYIWEDHGQFTNWCPNQINRLGSWMKSYEPIGNLEYLEFQYEKSQIK